MQKTKIQIIDETVEYYSADPKRRATTKGALGRNLCIYLAEDGRTCAFSRCMIEPLRAKNMAAPCDMLIDMLTRKHVERNEVVPTGILKPEYDGYTISFWLGIQGLHDNVDYWDDKGMTGIGKMRVETMKETYKD